MTCSLVMTKKVLDALSPSQEDVTPQPWHIIFINMGVKLLEKGANTADAVVELEKLGIQIVA